MNRDSRPFLYSLLILALHSFPLRAFQPSQRILSQHPSEQGSFESPSIPLEQLSCRPTGWIQDTACNYETVDEVNRKLHSQLSRAVQLPIFRYHKVDLYRQCPFWSEDGLCGNQACAVNELDREDVPAYWRTSELSNLRTADSNKIPIDLANKCVVKEQDYCVLDDHGAVPSNGVYVDLLANPERFTGYSGPSAQRVWRAVYEENCFNMAEPNGPVGFGVPPPSPFAGLESKPQQDTRGEESCLEKRVYYKLLSGLHTSISMHICDEYLDPGTGKWVPNLQCYLNRIGLHPERLTNLYFAYTLMLRALSRSASYLNSPRVELCTGDKAADQLTREALEQLISTAHSYPVTFDETSMFKGSSPKQSNLKEEFKQHFRNVSRIMDCIGCDKCRLWGKLQVMGLGTALKLLFEYEDENSEGPNFHLTRQELIAFINTLNRLSESLEAVEKFRKLWKQRDSEGTLPVQVADEKLDASLSGRAANAIALFAGLGPRPQDVASGPQPSRHPVRVQSTVPSPGKDPEKKESRGSLPGQTQKESMRISPSSINTDRGVLNSVPSRASDLVGAHQQTLPAPARRPDHQRVDQKKPSAANHSAQNPTARPSIDPMGRPSRQVVMDLPLITRPAMRLFKLLSHQCVRSVSSCMHWLDGGLGHIKALLDHSSSSYAHLIHLHREPTSRGDRYQPPGEEL